MSPLINYPGVPDAPTLAGLGGQPLPTRILTVSAAGQGGEFTTIALAIAAAAALVPSVTKRICILLMPGVYAEQGLEIPDYVDLIGVSREGCIIEAVGDYEDPAGNAASSALIFVSYNSSLENVTVSNTYAGGYATAVTVAAYINDETGNLAGAAGNYYPVVRNCTIKSASTFALCMLSDSYSVVEDCAITGGMYSFQVTAATRPKFVRRCTVTSTFTAASVDESPLWLGHSGDLHFEFCTFRTIDATEGGTFIDNNNTNGLNIFFRHCEFMRGAAYDSPGPVMTANPKAGALNVVIGLNGCVYDDLGSADPVITWTSEHMGDGAKTMGGDLQVDGATGVSAANGFNATANTSLTNGLLTLAAGITLYPEGVSVKTDNPFESADAVTGTAGVISLLTQWHYFDAVSEAAGEIGPVLLGALTSPGTVWEPNAATNPAYIYTVTDGMGVVFPVPYEPGSIISRVSVRWQGVGANDGIIFTLQERQGGTAAAAWAAVGAAQTVTGVAETNTVYDVADKMMVAGYEYRVLVESQTVTTGSRLWEIGIETIKRVY